jgi:glyoxylase-like metal-dependent hydrolase (beta-lactamase superfamily II)
MKRSVYLLSCAFFIPILFACARNDKTSNLVKSDKWWKIHPRPVYLQIESTGNFEKWFDVYRLCRDTYAIYEPNQFEEVISYLIFGEKRAVLIDTGLDIGDIRKVIEELTDLPVSVVLTHEHYDHIAGAHRFERIICYDNSEALAVLKQGRDHASLRKYITADYLWKPLPEGFDSTAWSIPPIQPTSLVHDGDIMDLGNRVLEVIYTPGHSPGSMCLLDKTNRILFTGDHFYPGPLYAYAPDVSMTDYIASNQKLVHRIDEYDFICSGHNDPWIESEVILRVSAAFKTIMNGEGLFNEKDGLRRYYFQGFDVLIREAQISR